MRPILTALASTTLLLLSLCAPAAARQEPLPAKPVPRSLAVQIVDPRFAPHGAAYEVHAQGSSVETGGLSRPLPGWKQPPGKTPLTGIRFNSAYEADGVRLRVALVFDDSEPADAPGPKYGRRVQDVGEFFAREGESVAVPLERYGFETMTLKVVQTQPTLDEPAPDIHPLVDNPLQSVAVVSFERDQRQSSPQFATAYRLMLRNLSAKAVTAFEVRSEGSSQRMEGSVIAAPGATFGTSINVDHEVRRTQHAHAPDARPRTYTVTAVVFADGTHEGDSKVAADLAVQRRGRQIQRERVLQLLQLALDAPAQDAGAALEKLVAQISHLRIDAEPSVVDEMTARFPELAAEGGRTLMASRLMRGLSYVRDVALSHLQGLQPARARDAANFDFRQSLQAVKDKIASRAHFR